MKRNSLPSNDNSKAISRSKAVEDREKREQADEAKILSLLRNEAESFVPNVLPKVKKETGTFDAIETGEELSLTEILGNEGGKMIPDLEKLIYQRAGIKKSFRLGDHLSWHRVVEAAGACLSFVFIVAATVAAANASGGLSKAPGALIRLSIAPASSQESPTPESDADSANPYKPEFLLVPTAEGQVYETGVNPMNLSATYVISGLEKIDKGSLDLDKAFSNLFEEAYQTGYIEAKTPKRYNKIEIAIVTDQSDYQSLYLDGIEKALKDALLHEKVYAKLSFECNLIEPSLSEMEYEKVADIFSVYELLNKETSYETLLGESDSVIEALAKVGKSLAAVPISDAARKAIGRGLSVSYGLYSSGIKKTVDEGQIASLKDELIANLEAIPWKVNQGLLDSDPYYLLNDPDYYQSLEGADKDICDLFFEVQKGIFSIAASSKENYLAFLSLTAKFLNNMVKDPSLCLDPYGYAYDPGGHKPGPGATSENWGDGDILLA